MIRFALLAGALLVTLSQARAADASYNTQLFNLVENRKSLVDGRNHYRKDFSQSFDRLLAQSQLAKADDVKVPLKKRLLSGPAGEPETVTDGGREYLYYRACQAHMCDETNLGLLYEPAAGRMTAVLRLKGKQEYLGAPAPAERVLLEKLQPAS
jgi:hypothetical protein